MTRPGDRLRHLASKICAARTMERVVDPIVADLQSEHAEAIAAGRRWKARVIRLRAAFTLAHSVCLATLTGAAQRRGRTALGIGSGAFAVCVAYFVGVILYYLPITAHGNRFLLVVYLLPQAIPISLSFALLCGAAYGRDATALDFGALRRVAVFSIIAALAA